VPKLTRGTTYHFAIRSKDVAGNWSDVSAMVSVVPQDKAAPKAISLKATAGVKSVALSWAAPAEDLGKSPSVAAAAYDIRYSTDPITAANFDAATPWANTLAPGVSPTAQSITVTGRTTGTKYYFAIKSQDAAGNWSAISNVAYAVSK
jgi:chitodextrinase